MNVPANRVGNDAVRWLVLPLAAILIDGCASNAVVLSTATRTGVEINATEAGQQGAHIGFDRFEGVIMPIVSTNEAGQTIYLKQAYPIYSKYYFHSGGLVPTLFGGDDAGLVIKQSFATGIAATQQKVRERVDADFLVIKGVVPDLEVQETGSALLQTVDRISDPNLQASIIDKAAKAFPGSAKPTSMADVKGLLSTAMRKGQKKEMESFAKAIGFTLK